MERRVLMSGADPDPTFSTDGEFTLSVPTGAATANDAIPLAGGKTLIVGTGGSEMFESRGDFLLARLTAPNVRPLECPDELGDSIRWDGADRSIWTSMSPRTTGR